MSGGTNISLFLLSFFPALIYAIVIWFSFPKKTINIRLALLHFLMGTIAVLATQTFNWVLPFWSEIYYLFETFVAAMAFKAFVQVALIEETMKLMMYKLTEIYRRRIAMPLSTMFYAMCISAGFAVYENMGYIANYGFSTGILRATTAVVIHMILGLMLGYFISLGTRFKSKWRYRILGLIFVTILHGIYDFNLFIMYFTDMFGRTITTGLGINVYWVVGGGLLMVLIMFLHIRWLKTRTLPFNLLKRLKKS